MDNHYYPVENYKVQKNKLNKDRFFENKILILWKKVVIFARKKYFNLAKILKKSQYLFINALEIFGNRLIGLMGNLSNVSKTKNKFLEHKFKKFIDTKKIPFTLFNSNPTT